MRSSSIRLLEVMSVVEISSFFTTSLDGRLEKSILRITIIKVGRRVSWENRMTKSGHCILPAMPKGSTHTLLGARIKLNVVAKIIVLF
jgi:hypothetical protein